MIKGRNEKMGLYPSPNDQGAECLRWDFIPALMIKGRNEKMGLYPSPNDQGAEWEDGTLSQP